LAFPCFHVGLFALPLCGAALTFFAAAKKATVLRVKRQRANDHALGGLQGVKSRIIALSWVSSLRIPATKATLVFLPLVRN
jgi:hypothetical protein